MNKFFLLLMLSLSASQTGRISEDTGEDSKADNCCAHRTADGKCIHELIPGCSTNEMSSESMNNTIENTGTIPSSDSCCAHWMADGKCAHELIPGCSN